MAAASAPSGGAGMNASRKSIIGSGGFGFVIKPALPNTNASNTWQEFPDNVTKVFYKKTAYNTVLKKTANLPTIFGPNNGHRIYPYRHSYTMKNLPANIKSRLGALPPETALYPLRMPYLGRSIAEISAFAREIQLLPVKTIVAQMVKLLRQVKSAKDHGFIHGDIREPNVMVNPETGVMTLIDFDWLLPFEEFRNQYPVAFYCHPPETLVLYYRNLLRAGIPESRAGAIFADKAPSYVDNLRLRFKMVFNSLNYAAGWRFTQYIDTVFEDVYQKSEIPVADGGLDLNETLETFDSFGMAMTLLQFIGYVYPGCIFPGDITEARKDAFKIELTTRLICTDEEVDACANLLLQMTHRVLIPLSKLK
jgi:serine/threonine protein kinase